jgi:2-keto-3-deoxy-L-fuconate dehydrogenase
MAPPSLPSTWSPPRREPVKNARTPLGIRADVTDDDAVQAAIEEVVGRIGGLDILVNNAGVGAQGTVETDPYDEWHRVFGVNVVGIVRVTRAALPHLRRSDRAAIVNTCSLLATVGLPERVLYGATKGAVYALTLAMAADHLAEGIRVNCVSPGTVDTPWVGRLLENAEDPAAASAALGARQPLGRLVSADGATDAAVMDQMLRRLRPAMAPGQGRPMSLGYSSLS